MTSPHYTSTVSVKPSSNRPMGRVRVKTNNSLTNNLRWIKGRKEMKVGREGMMINWRTVLKEKTKKRKKFSKFTTDIKSFKRFISKSLNINSQKPN